MTVERLCPKCGQAQIIKVNRQTKERFLGCTNYPVCYFTEPLPVYFDLVEQGAPRLPGLDSEEQPS